MYDGDWLPHIWRWTQAMQWVGGTAMLNASGGHDRHGG